MNGFVLAGTHSGVGKTTITAGIMKALKLRGYEVQAFKSGPDYIDPVFHEFVTKRKSRNLDAWMLSEETLQYLFSKHARVADVAVVEGVMGLYDGYGTEKDSGSTAYLSKVLKLPVILIVDGSGMAASAAALVSGFVHYDKSVQFAGVIVNKVSGQAHYDILKEAIERDTGIPCLGYVAKNQHISLESRHLGLVPAGEVVALNEKLDQVAQMVESTIDLDRLIALTMIQTVLDQPHPELEHFNRFKGLNIGVALDQAFNFYYWDNLDLMQELGCQLTFFSPLTDSGLPDAMDLLYIGGGFPEVFASELTNNLSMRQAIKQFADDGKPIYAECGGLMYLCNHIQTLEGKVFPMVGIVDGNSIMTGSLKRFGYVEVETSACILGEASSFKGHEFHRSIVEGTTLPEAYKVYKYRGQAKEKQWGCGYRYRNCLAAYAHVHFYSKTSVLLSLLESAEHIRGDQNE